MQEYSRGPHGCRQVDLFTGDSLRSISEALLTMGLAVKKKEITTAPLKISPLPLPKPKDIVKVTVSLAVNPTNFHVQLVRP